jgi:hypothetical protein
VIGGYFGCPTYAITDSNSVALTQRYCVGGSVDLDYVVSGSPTGVYTCTSTYCGLLNVTGATVPPTYSTTGPCSSYPCNIPDTIATQPGDLIVASILGANSFSGYSYSGLTFAGDTTIYNLLGTGGNSLSYGFAAGTSVTYTPSGYQFIQSIGLADYTAASPPASTKCNTAYPYPCSFQSGYAPGPPLRRRAPKLTLADLLR